MTLVKSIQYNVLMHNDDNPSLNRKIDQECTNVASFFLTQLYCQLILIQYRQPTGLFTKRG